MYGIISSCSFGAEKPFCRPGHHQCFFSRGRVCVSDAVILQKKLQRLAEGAPPRVLDLFSGCGGLSLGFSKAGFQISAAIEFDQAAAASHAVNFHQGKACHMVARDITTTPPQKVADEFELGPVAEGIDVIVGGPPCQAFARVGRSKLREILEHPEAYRQDPRSRLYMEYLKYVEAFQPVALLMENVPDVLNHGGQNIAEETAEFLEDLGYVARYTLLNAAYYGVPQMRERMFLVAYRQELGQEVSFPLPTHWLRLPPGYEGSRQVALKFLKRGGLFEEAPQFRYVHPPEATPDLTPAVTAREALSDLPTITAHLEGRSRKGAQRFEGLVPYPSSVAPESYAHLMRHWPGFENDAGLKDHVIRHLPRDWDIFRRMNPGDQYPQAWGHAQDLFQETLVTRRAQGEELSPGTPAYEELKAAIVPPYDVTKFPNKWRKMEADRPARTLMAHLGKDSYSHIHYDSAQARTISVREAARLQSFPDGFVFRGTMNPAFKQIGNAVPPLLAWAIAGEMRQTLQIGIESVISKEQHGSERTPAVV